MEVFFAGKLNLVINGKPIENLFAGKSFEVAFANDKMVVTDSGSGRTASEHALSGVADVTVRVLRGSQSDTYLNSLSGVELTLNASHTLKSASITKEVVNSGIGGFIMKRNGGASYSNTESEDPVEYVMSFRQFTETL